MDENLHRRALSILTWILLLAVAVSVVHYVDNYVNYADFPQSDTVPNPSKTTVGAAWFFFTAFGVAGYLLFRRRRYPLALVCLAVYSGSGLVGIGHYLTEGMTDAVWWRQAHVVADIVLGASVLAFCLWAARRLPMSSEEPGPGTTLG